jgi:predicted transcriptional regulator
MASNLLELAADIVSAHASNTEMTTDQLMDEIKIVYATLKGLEQGESEEASATPQKPAMTVKQAFKKDQVGCMICGKTGLTTLKRHLTTAHDMKPGQYRKQFNISKDQPLAAMNYVEKRRQMALDKGLGDNLAKARAAKKPKAKAKKAKK